VLAIGCETEPEPQSGDAGDGSAGESDDGAGSSGPTGSGDGEPQGCDAVPEDMACIESGTYWMGCNPEDPYCYILEDEIDLRADERPFHEVRLDAFLIDLFEVDVTAYAECVDAGACTEPYAEVNGELCTWGVTGQEDYPANCVTWDQAREYCEWRGRRLPTEAEWAAATRGESARLYSWGNSDPTCDTTVMWSCAEGHPLPVGSAPDGATPEGVQDLIGNVCEWTADWYSEDYYSVSPVDNPTGPASGTERSVRGPAFRTNSADALEASRRGGNPPDSSADTRGFRCAATP